MSYIGASPTNIAFVTDTFSGNGSTVAFTTSVAPASTSSILVAVTGVLQDPSTYSVSGTTLTFSAAPPSGTSNISVRYLGIPASGVTTTAYRTVTNFTATAGQTTFSTPSYTVGYIDVYRNGSRLGTADYTATNGTTVVLAAACNAGDLVVTESFYVSSVLNAIPATAGAVTDTYVNTVSASKLTGSRTLPSGTLPAGTILQVQSTTKTDVFTSSSAAWVDVTGLSVSITPTSSTSKILVFLNTFVGNVAGNNNVGLKLVRNSTDISVGTAATGSQQNASASAYQSDGNNIVPVSINYLDSPASATSVTYKVQVFAPNNTAYINEPQNNSTNANYIFKTASTITVMEVAV